MKNPSNSKIKFGNQDNIHTRAELLSMLLEAWSFERKTEIIPTLESCGRILAKDVYSLYASPQFRVSGLDGIAVKSELFENGVPETSSWKEGVDFVRADTGDDFPDEFDSVIAIEDVSLSDGVLSLNEDFSFYPKCNTRPRGDLLKEKEPLGKALDLITPMKSALIAAGGHYTVEVLKPLRFSYIPTGDELVSPGTSLTRGKTFESNSALVYGILKEKGASLKTFPIIKDNKNDLANALDDALDCSDVVLINGGSSKGSEDFNTALLESRSDGFFTHYVKAGPGRPIALAIIAGKPVINIPGPPVSCFVGLDWCINGLLDFYNCQKPKERQRVKAVLADDLKKKKNFEMYYWFNLERTSDGFLAHLVSRKETLATFVNSSNALFVAELDRNFYEAGETIELELLCGLNEID